MAIREKDIIFETDNGISWVLKEKDYYTVMVNRNTHSVSDSSYPKTEDGFSLAVIRAKYLDKRKINR